MTVEVELDYLVGDDNEPFSSSQKSDAISAALSYISGVKGTEISSGDDKNTDRAAALLAEAILYNKRNARRNQTDPSIQIKTTGELFTEDMRNLLFRDDPMGESKYVKNVYVVSNEDDHWSSTHV